MKKILCVFTKKKDIEHPEKYPYPVTFYGYDRLIHEKEFQIERLDIYRSPGTKWLLKNPLWIVWRPLELYFHRLTCLGFSLGQLVQRIRYLNTFDLIYGLNDTSGLPLSLLKKLGILKPKIIFISAGLINNLYDQPSDLRTHFLHWFLSAADCILAWSPLEQSMFQKWGMKSELIPLEADTNFFKPEEEVGEGRFVFFSGRDIGRDSDTLIAALEELRYPAVFITNKNLLPAKPLPPNVKLITDFVEHDELKRLYRDARIVVVPVKEISRISGQTSLLESLAMGKATIVSKTKAFLSAYPELEDTKHILWYEPENKEDFKSKLQRVWEDRELQGRLEIAGREFVESLPKDWFYSTLKKEIRKVLAS